MNINNTKKWQLFCERLIQKTQNDQVSWEDWSEHILRDDSQSAMFVATYEDWNILIYRNKYKAYDEYGDSHMIDDIAMEIVDEDGTTEWLIPKVPARTTLFDHVQYIRANIDKLLDQILQD